MGTGGSTSSSVSAGSSTSSSTGSGGGGAGPGTSPPLVYAKNFGDAKDQNLAAVIADDAGNVYVAGAWFGVNPFSPSAPWLHGCTGISAEHAFVAKLAPDGTALWAECFGPAARALAASYDPASQTIAVAGSYGGTISGYPGGDVTSKGGDDGFVVRLSAAGTRLSLKSFGGPMMDSATGVVVTSTATYVTGVFESDATFDLIPRTATNGDDVFFGRIDATNAFTFAKVFTETAMTPTARLSGDGSTFVLAGSFDGSIDFGGSTSALASADAHDGYLALLDASGAASMATRFGGTGDDRATSVAVSPMGTVVGGDFSATMDADGAGGQAALSAVDVPDAFVAMFAAGGTLSRQDAFGAVGAQTTLGIGARSAITLAAGVFTGDVNFGGAAFSTSDDDGFLMKRAGVGPLDWVVRLGNTSGAQRAVACDAAPAVQGGFNVVGGTMTAGFMIEGQTLGHTGSTSTRDLFVAAFSD
jgi:hypothetical protein